MPSHAWLSWWVWPKAGRAGSILRQGTPERFTLGRSLRGGAPKSRRLRLQPEGGNEGARLGGWSGLGGTGSGSQGNDARRRAVAPAGGRRAAGTK